MALPLCPERDELSSLLEGSLSAERTWDLERHVDSCSDCQGIIESLQPGLGWVEQSLKSERPELERDCRVALERIRHLTPPPAVPSETISTIGVRGMLASLEPSLLRASSPPPEMIREYKLLAKIGEGGMGAVYKAEHTKLRRLVAIKVLPVERSQSPTAIARFDREMQAVGGLDHPNIVRAFDAGEHDGRHFLVMEFVGGCDASQLVDRGGPLPIPDACEIIRQAADGLQHAHQAGLVHRDIKPSNLMLTPEGTVKILDLGLALLSHPGEPGRELTSTGHVMGTIDYMAPEQGDDTHRVDIRADVYALGATLYKLLTGKSPFADARFDTTMKKLLALATLQPTAAATLRDDVPAPLSELVARLLAKSPDDRPATPGEVARLLQPFCSGADLAHLMRGSPETAGKANAAADTEVSFMSASVDTASAAIESLPEAKPAKPGNNRRLPSAAWLLIGVGGLVLLLGAALYWFNQGTRSKPPLAIAPFEAAEAKSHQQAWASYLGLPEEHINSIGMKFRLIPPGEFLMGSTPEEIEEALQLVNTNERISRESVESGAPQHRVRIKQPFYLSVHEVMQQDYEAVQAENPAHFKGGDRPVEMVSWNDALSFCVKLSELEGLKPHYSLEGRTWLSQSGRGYRLPSEAEWEYACRAGTTTKYFTGNRDSDLTVAAWLSRNSPTGTHSVGRLPANPFGLHDMHGNVYEWCQDAWDSAYYQQFDQTTAADPQGPLPTADAHRVTRGGSWMYGASRCRSSYRDHGDPVSVNSVFGFRVALPVEAVRNR